MKKLKKLELVKRTVADLSKKDLKELKGGNLYTRTGPNGTQVNTCNLTAACC